MNRNKIIFDLDGTLIDSGTSIINSINIALKTNNIKANKPLNIDLIGPPLNDIFLSIISEENKKYISKLIQCFVEHYDLIGYKETIVFEGVKEMLDELLNKDLELYIATNKRITATHKIMDYLGWNEKFKKVYTLDYFNPPMPNKKLMLKNICKELPKSNFTVYIGDRKEDGEAANEAKIDFFWAAWGYSKNEFLCDEYFKLDNPSMIFPRVKNYI
jgi:phosphoglycolate phosphatase